MASPSLALQVLAHPTSGKTNTLTAHVSYLIAERGLRPWNVVVCAYTVDAAREMEERTRDLVGDALEKRFVLSLPLGRSTLSRLLWPLDRH